MAKDIAIGMITVNRKRYDQTNYLFETLANLQRGGIWDSPRLAAFHLCDSDNDPWCCNAVVNTPIIYHYPPEEEHRHPTDNAGIALGCAALANAKWVLFLEDDIDVCANFLDSAGAWLDDHEDDRFRVYPLSAAYDAVLDRYRQGATSWEYPIDGFYGTQAFAIRSDDAVDLSLYFLASGQPVGYDLGMHVWAKRRYPTQAHFLTPVPSLVEHIGRESVIQPRPQTHTFQGWGGRDYSYQSRVRA